MKEMIGGCCVCSDDRGYDENPIVYCDGHGCNVAVHQACYGIITVPTGPWFCRKCESQERAARVRCELCPQKEGALKRTDAGGWCHVVCALYIPEVSFGSINSMEPIILKKVPQDRFNKSCHICEEQGRGNKATTGACMQCNYRAGCKQHFHVTCAQSMGLLREESGTKKKVSYCGYCNHHFKKLFSMLQKREFGQKDIKLEGGDLLVDKLKLEKSKLGEAFFMNEFNPNLMKIEPSAIRTPGKFTTANFTESMIEEVPAEFVDSTKESEHDSQYDCQDSPHQFSGSHLRNVESVQVAETPDKPYVPVSSVFAKTSPSMSESFMKLNHPSPLLQSTINPTSDSSSTCSFPSFGRYASPSRPNDFSEIRPENSGTFGTNQNSEGNTPMMMTIKTESRKKLKGDRKLSVRGRKPKESNPGEPPLLTSPPPPSDFTNISETPLLHPHDTNSLPHYKRNQQEQPSPWIPFPSSSSSHHHYSPPVYDLDSLGGNLETLPTSMEELLESQWKLGSQFLMQQGQRLDIVDLLNLLQQTKEKNKQMEKMVEDLTARRNYLMATNARLAMSIVGGLHPSSEDVHGKVNKAAPMKKEPTHVDSSHGNHESIEPRVNIAHPPKNQQQQLQQQHQQQQLQHQQQHQQLQQQHQQQQQLQQQPAFSFISTGLVNVNSTPPPLSINHLLQQPASPHNKHLPLSINNSPLLFNNNNPLHSFNNNNNNNVDKMVDHLRRQQKHSQLNQDQHNKLQQIQQQQQQLPTLKEQPTLQYPLMPPTPFYPTHLTPNEQQLYVLPPKNHPKKHLISPKNK